MRSISLHTCALYTFPVPYYVFVTLKKTNDRRYESALHLCRKQAPYRPQGNERWWLRCVLWNALGALMEVLTHASDWDDASGMMPC